MAEVQESTPKPNREKITAQDLEALFLGDEFRANVYSAIQSTSKPPYFEHGFSTYLDLEAPDRPMYVGPVIRGVEPKVNEEGKFFLGGVDPRGASLKLLEEKGVSTESLTNFLVFHTHPSTDVQSHDPPRIAIKKRMSIASMLSALGIDAPKDEPSHLLSEADIRVFQQEMKRYPYFIGALCAPNPEDQWNLLLVSKRRHTPLLFPKRISEEVYKNYWAKRDPYTAYKIAGLNVATMKVNMKDPESMFNMADIKNACNVLTKN